MSTGSSWFTAASAEKQSPETKKKNYDAIARSKRATLVEIREDPSVLFRAIAEGDEDNECITFFDLIESNRTVTESDLLGLPNADLLDWREIARRVPLSLENLRARADIIDWDALAMSLLYTADDAVALLREFHDRFEWERLPYVWIFNGRGGTALESLVFDEKLVPAWHRSVMAALPHTVFAKADRIAAICDDPRSVRALFALRGPHAFVGSLAADHSVHLLWDALRRDVPADDFVQACARSTTVCPSEALLDYVIDADAASIAALVSSCAPTEAFVDELVRCACSSKIALSSATWSAISSQAHRFSDAFLEKHASNLFWFVVCQRARKRPVPADVLPLLSPLDRSRQRLSEAYVEAHADELDWFELCEHQDFSEAFLRKHARRLNWGQVSQYQALSPAFVREFTRQINHVKLEMNKATSNSVRRIARCVNR